MLFKTTADVLQTFVFICNMTYSWLVKKIIIVCMHIAKCEILNLFNNTEHSTMFVAMAVIVTDELFHKLSSTARIHSRKFESSAQLLERLNSTERMTS